MYNIHTRQKRLKADQRAANTSTDEKDNAILLAVVIGITHAFQEKTRRA